MNQRRGTIITAVIALVVVMLGSGVGYWLSTRTVSAKVVTTSPKPKLVVISDPHFIDPKIHDDGPAFARMEATAVGKDLRYTDTVWQAFVKQLIAEKPTALVITGDVTFNGSLASAQALAKRLKPLQKHHIKVLVTPGNHDIDDGWARRFKGTEEIKIPQISPQAWQTTFEDGYKLATSQDPNSLSYTTQLNSHYLMVMLDSNQYANFASSQAPSTGGVIREDTMTWLKKQLEQAKQRQLTPLVFLHHNLYAHHSRVQNGFVLNNAPEVIKLLNQYQVPLVFSGHIHAQDVGTDPNGVGQFVEVVSGAFSITPAGYGEVELGADQITYTRKAFVPKKWLSSVPAALEDYQGYLKTMFLNSQPPVGLPDNLPVETGRQILKTIQESRWRYFAGLDTLDEATRKQLAKDPGYRALMSNPELSRWRNSISWDEDINDNHFTLEKRAGRFEVTP